jgi:hypothetical protein
MSLCNAINRITTIVVLPYSIYASNINNKLFLLPIGIIATTGLSPAIIASIASYCTLQNLAILLIICFNYIVVSIFLNYLY